MNRHRRIEYIPNKRWFRVMFLRVLLLMLLVVMLLTMKHTHRYTQPQKE